MSDDRPALPSRRGVLVGGAALLLTGCTSSGDPATPPGPTLDERLAARAADEIRTLAATYTATIARHPATRSELSTLAAEHDLHIAALGPFAPPAASPRTGSPTPSATPPPALPVPSSQAAARAALASAEHAAARRRRSQTRRAGAELARLLASVAACEAVHAALLGGPR
jgi:hypothetical protein